ncbi:MAG: GAF domain-containing protein [Verrucomicrobiaceae bacterium]|nr:GAF domain-containing protein [Verrucomicrobiaceae bacterium]
MSLPPNSDPRIEAEYYARLADENAGQIIRADAQLSLARRELDQRTKGFRILSMLGDTTSLNSYSDMGPVLEATLTRIHEVFHVDRSLVLLEKPGAPGIFTVAHHLGLDPQVVKRLSALMFAINDTLLEGREHVVMNRATTKFPFIDLLQSMLGLTYFVCVPVKTAGATTGWLLASNDKEAYPFYPPFDQGHVEIFTAIAAFLGAALANQKLYRDLATAHDELATINSELEARVEARTADLDQRNQQLAREKERSEELLLNMLPRQTALELQRTGQAVPRSFEKAIVVFADIVGFTDISEKMSPGELVSELDQVFRAFDHIIQRYGLEKLKTIGDCYMFAGGLPVPNEQAATAAVHACLEFQEFLIRRRDELERQGKPYFLFRYGVNCGPVVAGVVGSKKFVYDVWGSTVNIAARLESAAEVGRVNISEATYELVKEEFHCVPRGEITVKHGRKIQMYYVEPTQPALS